jgi:glutaredoxin-like protein DUF836
MTTMSSPEPGAGASEARVVMYSRRRCGLCDEARDVVARVWRAVPFRFDEVFIDGDDALEARYGLRVPVLEVDGLERFEYSVVPDQLAAAVRR